MVQKGFMRIFQTSDQELDVFYALASKEIFNLALLIKFLTLNIAFSVILLRIIPSTMIIKSLILIMSPVMAVLPSPICLGAEFCHLGLATPSTLMCEWGKGPVTTLSRKIKCLFGNQAQNRSHLHERRHTYVFFFYLAHLNSKTFPRNMDTSFYNYIIVFFQASSVNQLLNKNKSHRGEVV